MILDIPSLHVTTCLWRQSHVFMNLLSSLTPPKFIQGIDTGLKRTRYCQLETELALKPTNVQLFRMALFRSIYDLRHPITPCHNLSLETITCFYE
jgi:hypothetical protein